MKYKTIEFDANRPITNQITAPLNSDYGVAVKVKKDGEYVNVAVTIDGESTVDGPDGWKLADLSSGNVTTTKKLDVTAEVQPTVEKTIEKADTVSTTRDRLNLAPYITFAEQGLPETITLRPADFDYSTKYRVVESEVAGEWKNVKAGWRIKWTDVDGKTVLYSKSGDKWAGNLVPEADEITVPTADARVEYAWNTIVTSTPPFSVEYVATATINTHDGFSAKFNLQVQERDLGYVELEPTEAAAAPAEEAPAEEAPAVEE